MGTYREQDPLAVFLVGQQSRVLDCLKQFANGEGAACITEARRILRALGEVEAAVLYRRFLACGLHFETERLLEDSRGNRAQHLAALDALARKRAAPLRKLAAVELCDLIAHHGEQHTSLLIPVLASQLPRPMYRALAHTFVSRVEGGARGSATDRETETRCVRDRVVVRTWPDEAAPRDGRSGRACFIVVSHRSGRVPRDSDRDARAVGKSVDGGPRARRGAEIEDKTEQARHDQVLTRAASRATSATSFARSSSASSTAPRSPRSASR